MAGGKGKRERDREQELADMTEAYSVEYLADVAGGDARQERLAELKRRIALGAYKPDPDAIAEGMLSRVNLSAKSDSEDDDEDADPDCGCEE
ncbi:MAG TPA: flagellar biosynthesis anti-sigma factor FlgM [Myxococcota bacterium]|nr:flagellar biosynthesis anti-sigma factor FlgM [Myxococcota bacterium]